MEVSSLSLQLESDPFASGFWQHACLGAGKTIAPGSCAVGGDWVEAVES